MDNTRQCAYCPVRLATAQGLHSHLAQSRRCHARHKASVVDSASDSDSQLQVEENGTDYNSDSDLPPYIEADLPIGNPEPVEDNPEKLEPRWQSRRATVDSEDSDESDSGSDLDGSRFIEDFPIPAGLPRAHSVDKNLKSNFEHHLDEQKKAGDAPWAPFESEDEWELARWLITSGVSQSKMDSFLKLNKVCHIVRNPNRKHELTLYFPFRLSTGPILPFIIQEAFSKESIFSLMDLNGRVQHSVLKEISLRRMESSELRMWNCGIAIL